MLFDLRSDSLLLQAFQNQLSLMNRQPRVAGEISSERSIVATSCSMASPDTASTTSFIVHFIPPAYPTPQLCMLSPAAFTDVCPRSYKMTLQRLLSSAARSILKPRAKTSRVASDTPCFPHSISLI